MYKVEMTFKFELKKDAEKIRSKLIHDFQDEIKDGVIEVYLTKD